MRKTGTLLYREQNSTAEAESHSEVSLLKQRKDGSRCDSTLDEKAGQTRKYIALSGEGCNVNGADRRNPCRSKHRDEMNEAEHQQCWPYLKGGFTERFEGGVR